MIVSSHPASSPSPSQFIPSKEQSILLNNSNQPRLLSSSVQQQQQQQQHEREEKSPSSSESKEEPPVDVTAPLQYIPLQIARSKIKELTLELQTMKLNHASLLDEIVQRYDTQHSTTKSQYEKQFTLAKQLATTKLLEQQSQLKFLHETILEKQLKTEEIDIKKQEEILNLNNEKDELLLKLQASQSDFVELEKQLIIKREELTELFQRRISPHEFDQQKKRTEIAENEVKILTDKFDIVMKQFEEEKEKYETVNKELIQAKVELEDNKEQLMRLKAAEVRIQDLEQEVETANAAAEAAQQEAAVALSLSKSGILPASSSPFSNSLESPRGSSTRVETREVVKVVTDPNLQAKVRELEEEVNQLMKKNYEVETKLAQEEAMLQAVKEQQRLQMEAQKKAIERAMAAGGGVGTESIVPAAEPVAAKLDSIIAPTASGPSAEFLALSATASSLAATASAASTQLTTLESRHQDLLTSITSTNNSGHALKADMEPKLAAYRDRRQKFMADSDRKAAIEKCQLTTIVEKDGNKREFKADDYKSVESMLKLEKKINESRPAVAAALKSLKGKKAKLEEMQGVLQNMSKAIKQMKTDNVAAEEVSVKQAEFDALRAQHDALKTEAKAEKVPYDALRAQFDADEKELQAYFTTYKVNEDGPEGKKKLNHEAREAFQALIDSNTKYTQEKVELKALGEEVKQKKEEQQKFKADIEEKETEIKKLKAEIVKLQGDVQEKEKAANKAKGEAEAARGNASDTAPAASSSSTTNTSSTSASTSTTSSSTNFSLPLLDIPLPVITPRIIAPVVPRKPTEINTNFPSSSSVSTSDTSRSTTSSSSSVDPAASAAAVAAIAALGQQAGVGDAALQARLSALQKQLAARNADLAAAKRKLAALTAEKSATTDKESELQQVKSALKLLQSTNNADERFNALTSQMEVERERYRAQQQELRDEWNALQEQVAQSQKDLRAKEEEIADLQLNLSTLQTRLAARPTTPAVSLSRVVSRPTSARPTSARSRHVPDLAGGNLTIGVGGGGGGSVGGGMTAADLAAAAASAAALSEAQLHLETKQSELEASNTRVRELEARVTSLTDELDSVKRTAGGSQATIQQEVDRLRTELNETTASLTKEKETSFQLNESVANMTAERKKLLSEIDDLHTEAEKLQADAQLQVQQLQSTLEADYKAKSTQLEKQHENKLKALDTTITDLTKQLRTEQATVKTLTGKLDAETASRIKAETKIVTLEAEAVDLKKASAEAVGAMDGLKGIIKERDGTIVTQKQEIKEQTELKLKWIGDFDLLMVRFVEEQARRKAIQLEYEDAKGKIRVYSRVRPFTKAEIALGEKTLLRPGKNEFTLELNETQKDVQGNVTDKWRPYVFDHIFQFGLDGTKSNGSQLEVFEEAKVFAEMAMTGINTCIFAYGQSGTGKTFTMGGIRPSEANGMTTDLLGLKPRMIKYVWELAEKSKHLYTYEVTSYMVEIYLDVIEDLFWKLDTSIAFKGKKKKDWPTQAVIEPKFISSTRKLNLEGVSIKGPFTSGEELDKYTETAEKLRRVRKTGLNEESSRSHLVFAMIITQISKKDGMRKTGKLSLVDLAGSERANKTNVEGLAAKEREEMLAEGTAINLSLSGLKNVFRTLGTAHLPLAKGKKAEVIDFRTHKLTALMQDSLGGGAKTLMFVNVGPAASNITESIDSLQYGDYVKNITSEKVTAEVDWEGQVRQLNNKLKDYEQKLGIGQ